MKVNVYTKILTKKVNVLIIYMLLCCFYYVRTNKEIKVRTKKAI